MAIKYNQFIHGLSNSLMIIDKKIDQKSIKNGKPTIKYLYYKRFSKLCISAESIFAT